MRCFHARTNAHVLHLQSKSYAEHVALNEFYDGIIGLTDAFAETYQAEELIEGYSGTFKLATDPLAMLEDLAEWIEDNRYECCDEDETCLQSLIDDLVVFIKSTIYKLKFLK